LDSGDVTRTCDEHAASSADRFRLCALSDPPQATASSTRLPLHVLCRGDSDASSLLSAFPGETVNGFGVCVLAEAP